MSASKSHCRTVSRRPAAAVTAGQLKFEALGDLVSNLELARRSAPWGVIFVKAPEAEDPDTDTGGGTDTGTL